MAERSPSTGLKFLSAADRRAVELTVDMQEHRPSPAAGPAPLLIPGPGGELALHDLGGDGPILLMAHATGMHGWVFRPLAEQLAEDFHCWALDLRGHGDSTMADTPEVDWTGFGHDVLAVTDYLDADPIVGFGHSLGGAALVMAADQRRGAFHSLLLYEPAIVEPIESAPRSIHDTQALMVAAAERRRSTFNSRADAIENYATKLPMSEVSASSLHAYVAHGFAESDDGPIHIKCRPDVEAKIFAGTFNQDAWRCLGNPRCPIHLIQGAATDDMHESAAAEMATIFDLPLRRVEGLGHFGPLQNSRQIADVIHGLSASLDEGGSE
jgi:pimeloyl-ACP methyl ester carboxylesterase